MNRSIGDIIAFWTRAATDEEIRRIRGIVYAAIAESGIDATATVGVESEPQNITLGHNPVVAVLSLNGKCTESVRTRKGEVIKGLDTIKVVFARKAGVYEPEKNTEIWKSLNGGRDGRTVDGFLAFGDAMPWEGEVVQFSAWTNGKVRGYRCRNWECYSGEVPFGFSGAWEDLKPDFTRYLRSVVADIGR